MTEAAVQLLTDTPEFSIVLPCLNEAETLERCIHKALAALNRHDIIGEVVVADNGSTDGSAEIAQSCGARVINVSRQGYGAALLAGFLSAHGKYIIMADSDDSYDLSQLQPFIDALRSGVPFVLGTRMQGHIMPGAMPLLHRYVGNPLLTTLGNLIFGTHLSDYHCGMRGVQRSVAIQLGLHTPGMEFATEMVAKAALNRVTIVEVPITYHKDGRSRPSHLRTWRDGWRHLRFILTSPLLHQVKGIWNISGRAISGESHQPATF